MSEDFISKMKNTMMFREINQGPESIMKTMDSVSEECTKASIIIKNSDYVYIVGSGTSYHAGIVLQIRLLNMSIPAVTVKAPEFSFYLPKEKKKKVTAVLISQSGESRDIIDSLNEAKKKGISTICIVNTKESTLALQSDLSIVTTAGKEKAVAATKTFISCLSVINVIISKLENGMSEPDKSIAGILENFLSQRTSSVIDIACRLKDKIVVLGNGPLHALALEGALKFKETSTIETEAYPIREYLHGPIQSLNRDTTVILLRMDLDETKNVMEKLMKQTDSIISIGFGDDDLMLPKVNENNIPIMFSVPLQIMANYKAVSLGKNPDQPTYLTKVVR